MVVSKTTPTSKINITLEGKPVQQRDKMIYLGSLKTEDGKCEKEIKRIEIARSAFEKMSKVLTLRTINIQTRKRASPCYIWSMLFYGSETQTLTKAIQNKLEAFEMWIYRRMMRISWTEHKSNEEVLQMTISKRSLIVKIKKRKLQYFRHLIRQNGIQRLLLKGKGEHGRSRMMWMDNIKDWTGLKYGECVQSAKDWIEWRAMTANLLRVDGTT